jgi:uncharacterized protein
MDVVAGRFEWDAEKNRVNKQKHMIGFEDATELFDTAFLKIASHRANEMRWVAIGRTYGRTIAVIYTERNGRIRLISARMARTYEREIYKQKFGDTS